MIVGYAFVTLDVCLTFVDFEFTLVDYGLFAQLGQQPAAPCPPQWFPAAAR